jgi:hypothetical protein
MKLCLAYFILWAYFYSQIFGDLYKKSDILVTNKITEYGLLYYDHAKVLSVYNQICELIYLFHLHNFYVPVIANSDKLYKSGLFGDGSLLQET